MVGALDRYYLLGRTGLRVSPLGLGTMLFGLPEWGSDENTSRSIFRRYLDAGGNFVDTANSYGRGRSEELVGTFLRDTGSRDRVVLATKYTGPTQEGNPNATGNGRKNLIAALNASLRRLGTDYVDVYWMHFWDTVTPVEEVMSTFDALVRAGKVRAIGLSNVPAWYATKAQTFAGARGWEPVAAMQLEYSLIERHIEREHLPAGHDLGMGLVVWSPLAGGLLAGGYSRSETGPHGDGRLSRPRVADATGRRAPTERDWRIIDALAEIAEGIGRGPAQVALNWVARRPGVTSTLIGARTVEQFDDNLAALEFDLPDEHAARLDDLSRPALYQPYLMFDPEIAKRRFTQGFDVYAEPVRQ